MIIYGGPLKMDNIDETFRLLKRTTFEEVNARVMAAAMKHLHNDPVPFMSEVMNLCHWTEDEYNAEYANRDIGGLYE